MSSQTVLADCDACKEIKEGRPGYCLMHGLIRLPESEVQTMSKKYGTQAMKVIVDSASQQKVPAGYQLAEEWQPRLTKQSVDLLRKMKNEKGLRDYDALVKLWSESARGRALPEAGPFILNHPRPAAITGLSSSGKTFTMKHIVKDVENLFVLDVSNEYEFCTILSLGDIFSMDWSTASGRYRFIPEPMTEMSKLQADMIFRWLHMIKGDGRLKKWPFIIEEAHRFKDLDSVKSFIIEGRKYTKVVLVVATDYEPYETSCDLFKPYPMPQALETQPTIQ